MVIRLIDTATLRPSLYESDNDAPPYAILSHTWKRDEEVSLQELEELAVEEISSPLGSMPERDSYYRPAHPTQNRTGFSKIVECCRKARLHSLKYVWIDTCCIDKKDPTELSEAINSMFRWYQHAAICYVYLPDMDLTASEWVPYAGKDELTDDDHDEFDIGDSNYSKMLDAYGEIQDALEQCRWFTRGWCLQELIAPREIKFYDMGWRFIGSKKKLVWILSMTTGVPQNVLTHKESLDEVPIAEKMSWAGRRQTTRVEDRAYCLVGIFGIYMPLLYGEGDNAFLRLQEEIIKRSDDLSIFAPLAMGGIRDDDERIKDSHQKFVPCDLFASGPEAFANVREVVDAGSDETVSGSFSMTNNGLHLTGVILRANMDQGVFTLPLNYQMRQGLNATRRLELLLRKTGPSRFVPLICSWETTRGAGPDYSDNIICDPEDIYIIDKAATLYAHAIGFGPRPHILGFATNLVDIRYLPHLVKPIDPRPLWDLSGMGFIAARENSYQYFRGTVAIDMAEANSFPGLNFENRKSELYNDYVYLCCARRWRDFRMGLFREKEWVGMTGGREDRHRLDRIYERYLRLGLQAELQIGSLVVTAKIEDTRETRDSESKFTIHLDFKLQDSQTLFKEVRVWTKSNVFGIRQ